MIETLVALLFGHVLADFVLQNDAMVRRKREPIVLAGHVAVAVVASWAALGFAPVPALLLLIGAAHCATDAAKLAFGGPGFRPFALDQAAHVAAATLGATLFPSAYASGLWARLATQQAPMLEHLPQAMALGAAGVAAVWGGTYAVAELMRGIAGPADPTSLPRGGRLIGKLERLLILMLMLARQPDGIGFLIAAKSILRFNELAGTDRHGSEYVIVGTLASFAWAMGIGYAALRAIEALGS